jgi:hypothetical protein
MATKIHDIGKLGAADKQRPRLHKPNIRESGRTPTLGDERVQQLERDPDKPKSLAELRP